MNKTSAEGIKKVIEKNKLSLMKYVKNLNLETDDDPEEAENIKLLLH